MEFKNSSVCRESFLWRKLWKALQGKAVFIRFLLAQFSAFRIQHMQKHLLNPL